MKNSTIYLVALTWFFCLEMNAQVTGRVTDTEQQPIPQVNILIKDSDRGTQTNAQGEYAIDILVFSHLGMQAEEIRVKKILS